jgi:Ca2+/H+ antiporter, TMEM165/GDT1 family
MKRFWILRGLKIVAFAALAVAAIGYLVMGLWNAVLPAAAGLHPLTYLQAIALLVLARILFGGLRGPRHGRWHWRTGMQARWQQMTPEERAQFRCH